MSPVGPGGHCPPSLLLPLLPLLPRWGAEVGDEQTVVVPQEQQQHQQQTAEQQDDQQGAARHRARARDTTADRGRERRWRRCRGAEMEPQTHTFEPRWLMIRRHGPGGPGGPEGSEGSGGSGGSGGVCCSDESVKIKNRIR